jgi:hypothetical protein
MGVDELNTRVTHFCPYCHQEWLKVGGELLKVIPLTELADRKTR